MTSKKTIDKVFILAGGLGSRLNIYGKHNLKAFIEIDNETLIERQLRIINKIINPNKIFILITKQIDNFKQRLSEYKNVDFIEVNKDYSYKGLLLSFIEIEKKLSNNEKFILSLVIGGAIGNLYDRISFNAVPDFIDLHYGNFHWFTFNVADIFITLGITVFIMVGIFKKDR